MTDENKNIENNQDENQNRQECNKKWWKNVGLKPAYSLIVFFVLVFLAIYYIYENNIFKFRHNVFIKGPKMHFYHNGPAVLMNDGNVLVIGGDTKQAEIYDYKKNKFVLTKGEMNYKRKYGATATTLENGNILITGGSYFIKNDKGQIKKEVVFDSAEIYNPQTQNFTPISKMSFPRTRHIAIPIENGNVLIFDGQDKREKTVHEIEEFDIKTNTFKVINKINIDNLYWTHFVKIDTDKILLIGYKDGTSSPPYKYLYDYSKNNILPFVPEKNIEVFEKHIYSTYMPLSAGATYLTRKNKAIIVTRNKDKILEISIVKNDNADYTANVVNGNKVLFIGGDNVQRWNGKRIIPKSYFVDLNGNIVENINLKTPRFKHMSILLQNGNIIVLGGYGLNQGNTIKKLLNTEIYYK